MRARGAGAVCGVLLAVAACKGGATAPTALDVLGGWRVVAFNSSALPLQLGSYTDSVATCTTVLDSMRFAFTADSASRGAYRHRACVALAPPNDTTTTPASYATSSSYVRSGDTFYLTAAGGTTVDTVRATLAVGTLKLTYVYGGVAGDVYEMQR